MVDLNDLERPSGSSTLPSVTLAESTSAISAIMIAYLLVLFFVGRQSKILQFASD